MPSENLQLEEAKKILENFYEEIHGPNGDDCFYEPLDVHKLIMAARVFQMAEDAKKVIQYTRIPEGARNPERDAKVLWGEDLALRIMADTIPNKLDEEKEKEKECTCMDIPCNCPL